MIALVASPVFAQEEEQDIQIEIEAGCGFEAGIASSDAGVSSAMAAYPDKYVWFRNFRGADDDATYC